jgi:hypothetical protein
MYILKQVEVLYPKVDRPYRFDSSAGERGRSVPCDPTDDGAVYEVQFLMGKDQAKDLWTEMSKVYQEKKQKGWPAKVPQPQKSEDDKFIGKCRQTAAYDGNPVTPPKIFDSKNKEFPEGFQLGSGSVANIAVTFHPHGMTGGVRLRPVAIQVVELKTPEARSPFEATDGYSLDGGEAVTADIFDSVEEEEEEPTPEPKKAVKKKASKPTEDDTDISDIVDEWDD